MLSFRKVLAAASQNIRKWPANPRIYVVAVLMLIFIGSKVVPMLTFCRAMHMTVSPWIFPFLTSDSISLTFLMIGLVFIFCDAPFIDQSQPYVIVRSGRRNWLTGQVLYIAEASALYFLFIILITFLCLLPYLRFSNQWGEVLNTFSLNGLQGVPLFQRKYNINLSFSRYITANYQPLAAMVTSLFFAWLEGIFLGMVMFVLNMHVNRIAGTSAALILILLQTFAYQFGDVYFALYFSPVSWGNLSVMDATGLSKAPSLWYGALMLLIFIVLLYVFALRSEKRQNIEVLPQV